MTQTTDGNGAMNRVDASGLPEQFLRDSEQWPLEPADYQAFLGSFKGTHHRGLRFNAIKGSEELEEKTLTGLGERLNTKRLWPVSTDRIPWAKHAYYFDEDIKPGADPAHVAGLYYIQEPSAMLPAEVLGARPGERVADLCGAPGGKTSQIATDLKGEGLLVSNDISHRRALVLRRNIEQLGLSNVQVTAEAPGNLVKQWGATFDAILLDAPCSGEGMFRRDSSAIGSWEEYGPETSVAMQEPLLDEAAALLVPGGRLVYSTCTFNPEENEYQISRFLERHPEFRVVNPGLTDVPGLRSGLPLDDLLFDPTDVLRIWPQDGMGEGHFCALLVKDSGPSFKHVTSRDPDWVSLKDKRALNPIDEGPDRRSSRKPRSKQAMTQKGRSRSSHSFTIREAVSEFLSFVTDYMTVDQVDRYTAGSMFLKKAGEHIHVLPEPGLRSESLSYLKFGVHAGELKGRPGQNAFVPSHSFLLAQATASWRFSLHWTMADERLQRLMRGETLSPDEEDLETLKQAVEVIGPRPYLPIMIDGFPFAWVKLQGKQLKNLFPPGWRR